MKTIIDELQNIVDHRGMIYYKWLSNDEQLRLLIYMYNKGYKAGHHHTVEGQYTDVDIRDMETYHENEVHDILNGE